ncbi:MAG: hypothetical protein IJ272_07535 [Clostridia bacterium]|nr:hypothetical protein [Clostridia bacterium]
MNKSRLFVFQLKELIYTLIFIILTIILIVVLFNMFSDGKTKPKTEEASTYEISYKPGIYSTQIKLNNSPIDVEVALDSTQIKSITLKNLSNSVTTMYPLLEPSVEYIETQLANGTPLDSVKLDDSSKYTQTVLLDAISSSIDKAKTN